MTRTDSKREAAAPEQDPTHRPPADDIPSHKAPGSNTRHAIDSTHLELRSDIGDAEASVVADVVRVGELIRSQGP